MIRYRCWDTTHEKMFYPEQSLTLRGLIFTISMEGKCYLNGELAENQDRLIFMLSTGLRDKNVKEVYEGDIVDWQDVNVTASCVIEYSPPHFIGKVIGRNVSSVWGWWQHDPEVVGNIYERNHGLLEEKGDRR